MPLDRRGEGVVGSFLSARGVGGRPFLQAAGAPEGVEPQAPEAVVLEDAVQICSRDPEVLRPEPFRTSIRQDEKAAKKEKK